SQRRVLDLRCAEQIGREAVRSRQAPPEMREEHAGVEEHAVAELAHPREKALGADLLVEEPERGARIAAHVAPGGLHAALLREHADATRGLGLEVGPHRRADATRDQEL